MQILNDILAERGLQYGSFEENMMLVSMIYGSILLTPELSSALDRLDIDGKNKERTVANSTVNFARNMLALKAVRSLTAKGDSYKDCIYDFLNYKSLCERVLGKICPGVKEFFIFTDKFFNIDIDESMSFILKSDEVYAYFDKSIFNIDIEKE